MIRPEHLREDTNMILQRSPHLFAGWAVIVLLGCAGILNAQQEFTGSLSIKERISVIAYKLPQSLAPLASSYGTNGSCTLGPRLYLAVLADQGKLLGWTDSSGTGHVSLLSGASVTALAEFASKQVRGLVAHSGDAFAVLLYDPIARTMALAKYSSVGSLLWSTDITGPSGYPDFQVGDSRLAFGGGFYGAHFAVKGKAGTMFAAHNGENLRIANESGQIVTGAGWDWGVSHSMAQLVGYHPGWDTLTTVSISDCYPSKGIFVNTRGTPLLTIDATCSGSVSAQFGQMVPDGDRWTIVFNAVNSTCCSAQGIGLISFGTTFSPSLRWLTATSGSDERDPVIASVGNLPSIDRRFLVGWRLNTGNVFKLAVIDSGGTFVEAPEEVSSAGVRWGNRDDSFRTGSDGTVSWVAGDALSDTVKLYRFSLVPPSSVTESTYPGSFALHQNMPNPFNPSTIIRYELPTYSEVRLSVFDMLGREVSELVSEGQPAGTYDVEFDASGLTSGVYFYRLQAGEVVQTKRLVLLK